MDWVLGAVNEEAAVLLLLPLFFFLFRLLSVLLVFRLVGTGSQDGKEANCLVIASSIPGSYFEYRSDMFFSPYTLHHGSSIISTIYLCHFWSSLW